ncbi:PGF-CTERM sorting domain-containing protein [Ureibacillus sinduriensis]|uniref:PGF-CTERM archaeal protein-sorting signal domain-containing protein n=1 Tax=Ureibacillus sinduriensis BLB-1 = JCM 15800 TaxID=1384057 RepID=A0A0A3HQ18_9BACL|nr:PGF-CTERM sorting domain-containing protein [Ureibacillus sinduriensis]KGR74676.1 hypothetical protein CD33_16460 [Ureibacillus sinduriensis BLB-1 = JCM 15800]
MTQYNREELSLILQVLAGITLTMGLAFTLSIYSGLTPGFEMIIAAIGLAIIIGCWGGMKHLGFMVTVILAVILFAIYFNFAALLG